MSQSETYPPAGGRNPSGSGGLMRELTAFRPTRTCRSVGFDPRAVGLVPHPKISMGSRMNQTSPNARSFHDQLIVIDALEHSNWDRELLEELRAGGVTAIHVTLAVWENCRETLQNISAWHRLFENHGDIVCPGRSAAEIRHAKETGRTAIIFGFQNSSPIEDDVGLVQVFHELGVRI